MKAANLLIDDDGTVLLGDLGVAADLSEDSSHLHSSTTSNGRGYSITAKAALVPSQSAPILSSKRGVAFDGGASPAGGPIIRKRKSFVGTVSTFPEIYQSQPLTLLISPAGCHRNLSRENNMILQRTYGALESQRWN